MKNSIFITVFFFGYLSGFGPTLAEPIGETYIAGNTWRELQWPFNVEDMIALDTVQNFIYVVWT